MVFSKQYALRMASLRSHLQTEATGMFLNDVCLFAAMKTIIRNGMHLDAPEPPRPQIISMTPRGRACTVSSQFRNAYMHVTGSRQAPLGFVSQVASCSRPGTAAAAGAGGVDGRAGRQPCSSRPCAAGGRKGAAARNRLEARPTWPRRRPKAHAGFAAAGTLGSHHLADPDLARIRAARAADA
ncbi:hypothetical protein SEVIR_2G240033v4 [Setaria viridis]